MFRWYVKHIKTVNTVSYIGVAIVLVASIIFDAPTTVLVTEAGICLAYLIALGIFSSVAQKKTLNKAQEILENNCDPIELCEITSSLYKDNSKSSTNIINYCYALSVFNLESYENIGLALEQIKNSHMAITSKKTEALFYSLVCSINLYFGELEKAEEGYRKAYEAFVGITNEYEADKIRNMLLVNIVNLLLIKGDNGRAKAELYNIDESTQKGQVEKLLLQAKLDIVEEREEDAISKLKEVIAKGNKLAIVSEAEQMLEELDEE